VAKNIAALLEGAHIILLTTTADLMGTIVAKNIAALLEGAHQGKTAQLHSFPGVSCSVQ